MLDEEAVRRVGGAHRCSVIEPGAAAPAGAAGSPKREHDEQQRAKAGGPHDGGTLESARDIEAGFGDTPAAVSETVAAVIAAGAVGVNLEDRLRPVEEHVSILEAMREPGEREGVPLVINGRSDEFLIGERRLDEAIARGRAYLDAGADCFFLPGLVELDDTRRLVEELGGAPVNVLALPVSPPLGELAGAGVARVSFGPGPMGVAYAALGDAAVTLLARGDYPKTLANRP